jgi:hypothetical protein
MLTKVEIMNKVASFGVDTPKAGAVPIMVGRRYKQAPGREAGSHLGASVAMSAIISFSNSAGSNAGSAIRVAEISWEVIRPARVHIVDGRFAHHAFAVAIRPEQSQFAIISPIHLHTLKTFRGVVQDRCSGSNRQVPIWVKFRGLPASGRLPHGGDHVIRALRTSCNDGVSRLWDGHWGGRLGELQLGGI